MNNLHVNPRVLREMGVQIIFQTQMMCDIFPRFTSFSGDVRGWVVKAENESRTSESSVKAVGQELFFFLITLYEIGQIVHLRFCWYISTSRDPFRRAGKAEPPDIGSSSNVYFYKAPMPMACI